MRFKFTVGSDLDVLPRSYWEFSGSNPTAAECNTFSEAVYNALADPFKALLSDQADWTGVEVVDLSTDTSFSGEYLSSTTGTRGAADLPASASADVAFVIARRYRGGKPHIELPFGVSGDLQTPQTWTSAFVTAVNSAWADVGTAATANIWSGGGSIAQVNVSYYGPPNRNVTSSTGRVRTISTTRVTPLIDDVVSYGCQTRLGSVRRRLGKAA